ncbi:unnamed protein product, partial [Dibothriocephalus latus]
EEDKDSDNEAQTSRHWPAGAERVTVHSREAEVFWTVATLCHSVEVKASNKVAAEEKDVEMCYSAVQIAKLSETEGRTLLRFYRSGTLEFDSTRRRMSVLVQSSNDGRYFVFSKGAETAMLNQRALFIPKVVLENY